MLVTQSAGLRAGSTGQVTSASNGRASTTARSTSKIATHAGASDTSLRRGRPAGPHDGKLCETLAARLQHLTIPGGTTDLHLGALRAHFAKSRCLFALSIAIDCFQVFHAVRICGPACGGALLMILVFCGPMQQFQESSALVDSQVVALLESLLGESQWFICVEWFLVDGR